MHESDHLFASVLDHSPALIFVVTLDGRYSLVNPAHAEWLGVPQEQALGRSITELFSETRARELLEVNRRVIETGAPVVVEQTAERLGRTRVFHVVKFPLRGETGEIVAVGCVAVDITSLKRVEARSDFQASVLDQVRDIIVTADKAWNITYWNRFAEDSLQWRAEEVLGKNVFDLLVPPESVPAAREAMASLESCGKWEGEILVRRKDGTTFWEHTRTSVLKDASGASVGYVGIAQDITERKNAEEERRVTLQRLVTAQEDERRRISRELHDELGQILTTVSVGFNAIEHDVSGLPAALEHIAELRELTDRTLAMAHRIAQDLRPLELDRWGLGEALRLHVEEWAHHAGIETSYFARGLDGERLDSAVETALYRIAQEALHNIRRHARAARVNVLLERSGCCLRLTVGDDGCGFILPRDAGDTQHLRQLGLRGMCERAELLGGSLDIESAPGRGTSILARIPLTPDRNGLTEDAHDEEAPSPDRR